MDFGIAHVVGSELTSAEDVLGSPYYMAPEQLSKGPIGPHTDLFAFAVVLYRMLTGVLPFTGESFAAIAHAILHESPAAPELFSAQIPKALSQIVLRCLEKSPEDCYPSAEQALRDLAAAAAGKETRPPPPKAKSRLTPLGAGRRIYTLAVLTLLGLLAIVATLIPVETKSTRPTSASGAGAGAGAAIARTRATRDDNRNVLPPPRRSKSPRRGRTWSRALLHGRSRVRGRERPGPCPAAGGACDRRDGRDAHEGGPGAERRRPVLRGTPRARAWRAGRGQDTAGNAIAGAIPLSRAAPTSTSR